MSTTEQTIPLFLRQYELRIDAPKKSYVVSSSDFEPNALRFTFDIQMRAYQVYWFAEISIYNLKASDCNEIMGVTKYQNITVTVSASYKNTNVPQNSRIIWQGPVFQLLFERENVVDTKLTFRSIVGLVANTQPVIETYVKITQLDLIRQIAAKAQIQVNDKDISSQVTGNQTKLSRGKTVFGPPSKYFTQIAEQNNCQWAMSHLGLNFSSVIDSDLPTKPDMTFSPPALPFSNKVGNQNTSPSNGVIVGTPQQVPGGIHFTALLDPRVQVTKPYKMVHIDNSLIRTMKLLAGENNLGAQSLTVLDRDGNYYVVGVRFVGDTRGIPWYAEIDGVTQTGGKSLMMLLIGDKANTNRGQAASR